MYQPDSKTDYNTLLREFVRLFKLLKKNNEHYHAITTKIGSVAHALNKYPLKEKKLTLQEMEALVKSKGFSTTYVSLHNYIKEFKSQKGGGE